MKNIKIYLVSLFILLISCKDDIVENLDLPDYSLSEYLYQVMVQEKWYLWVDSINYVSPASYPDPNEYLDNVIYSKLDKWSSLWNISTFDAYFGSGEQVGYGFIPQFDEESIMRVALVLENSPFDQAGIKRGYQIIKINNNLVADLTDEDWREELDNYPANFTFIDHSGNEINETISKKV